MRDHVVPMINDSKIRRQLGYDLERCIQLKIVPCKLLLPRSFADHLTFLLKLRNRNEDVRVFYEADSVEVLIGFARFIDKLVMQVGPKTYVMVNPVNNRLTGRVSRGAEIRVARIHFNGDFTVSHGHRRYGMDIDLSALYGAWHLIVRKVDGSSQIITHNIAITNDLTK